ncbi:uncharacterized protein LOC125854722 [Solanum stenotomum]|uniref:uncharacterized protein LOC125854722 n=1 Tax=Solanum stenotomum TaxID=172797 RepID=UPI0020D0442E|nr:uncharacterized protein LOC125854722 [Solanum stenotomum]
MTNSSQVNVGTVSAATTLVAHNRSNVALAPAKKPAKFSGVDFKRWQQKMFFYLTTLSLQSGLQEDLYNVYNNVKTSKELWDALEKKYKTEDVGMKKFIVAKFLDYKMIDSKTVVTQVQEVQVIIHDLLAEGLIVNDVFQMAAIIEKLPPLWKDFKNYLKHKCKEMTVEDLMVRQRIEKDNKAAEKRSRGLLNVGVPKRTRRRIKQMLSECNLVGNPREWWIDYGTSCHVCANKELFASYTPTPADEKLFMANSATAKVEVTGKVHLKMLSGKVVTLNRVFFSRNIVEANLGFEDDRCFING